MQLATEQRVTLERERELLRNETDFFKQLEKWNVHNIFKNARFLSEYVYLDQKGLLPHSILDLPLELL